jgi:diacylglycerol kinase (ATP)
MTDNTPHKKNTGIVRLIKACGYTRDGLLATFRSEAAFRQEVALAVVLLPLAFFIAPGPQAFGLMAGSVLLVLAVELLNSAIECVVDRISPEHHPLCKQAKDAGSAAVFIALVMAAVVWAGCLL